MSALVVVATLIAACAGNPNPTRQIDDAIIAAEVRQAFEGDAELRSSDISIDAASGVITLRGRVASARVRDRAVALARGVPGVRDVVSQLTLP